MENKTVTNLLHCTDLFGQETVTAKRSVILSSHFLKQGFPSRMYNSTFLMNEFPVLQLDYFCIALFYTVSFYLTKLMYNRPLYL
jgi:hypothetical protein